MGKKFGNGWWIDEGVLMSDERATDLEAAAKHFPDDYDPMIFLTGDAHREPPFQWAAQGVWANFFEPLIEDNKIVCHVEQYPRAVTRDSVPPLFGPVFDHGKVFGWEHAVFPILENLMKNYYNNAHAFPNTISVGFLRGMLVDSGNVAKMGFLLAEHQDIVTFAKPYVVAKTGLAGVFSSLPADKSLIPPKDGLKFKDLYSAYVRAGMELRTGIHPHIAPAIQRLIDTYRDHIHLITCGDAHLLVNPLYQYLNPPVGCFGIVDPDQGKVKGKSK
ncbi:hypothetical protein KVG96_15090 [Pseudomonas sp. COR58]|uniref:Uncharacterized protein n=1 Tax=Pseudomonas ekonensis TaxID=2842353 RepID=A0ABS6PFM1_9PSED|nr:hypothetical protein [Pseudomonas ekonensis]MBV4459278.1 hypothetical protein [Pseudomonas ekonensis]